MGILDKFKYEIDLVGWRQLMPTDQPHAAGSVMCCDKRNDQQCDHSLWQVASATVLNKWSARYNGSMLVGSPALAAFAAGNEAVFVPSMTVTGTIGVGSTTTKIVTATATVLGSAIGTVGVNQFVTTDTDYGYQIRIINKATGRTEERFIRGNTSSATPVIYLDGALQSAPNNGDLFEILSGGIFMVAATTAAAGQSRHYSIATNAFANAGSTGITTGAASSMCALDEQYVPYNRRTGEGFLVGTASYDAAYYTTADNELIDESKNCLQATASAGTSITGQVTGGDVIVLANEYRNFQIRIVEDTVTPTAVGQRRIIQSHTAGTAGATAPVYTVATWSVTPSSSAKFVIENPNIILLQNLTQAGMLVYNYNTYTITNGTPTTIAAFTWSSTYFNATHGAAVATGTMCFPSYGHQPQTQTDGARLSRHSYVWFFRGNSVTLDRFDMAGAANGLWSDAVTYMGTTATFAAGACGDYDPVTFLGEYAYIQNYTAAGNSLMYQFNISAATIAPWIKTPSQSGTAAQGKRLCITSYMGDKDEDPENKLAMMYLQTHLGTVGYMYRSDITG